MQIMELNLGQFQKSANLLKAIAHPARIAIISILDDGQKLTVTEIHKKIKLGQSSTSHHLGILRNLGLLTSLREGRNTYYSLKYSSLLDLVRNISICN